jgi:hypothetical protein
MQWGTYARQDMLDALPKSSIQFSLDQDQIAVRDMACSFATDVFARHAVARDEAKHFPIAEMRQAAELGMGGAYISPEAGAERMGKRVVHCGEADNRQAAKICNNMILGISMIAVSEAFALGEKLGISHQALFDVASASSGQCWSLTSYCPVPGPVPASPANNDYKPGFAAALTLKDLKLAHAAAQSVHAHTALGAQATEIYAAFNSRGGSTSDFSGIINFIRPL